MTTHATPYVFTALEILTAAKMNGIQDNIKAGWPITAAGQVIYSIASNELAVLDKPSVDSVLKNTSAGVPSWLSINQFLKFCSLYHSTTQNVNNNTWTALAFDSEDADIPGWHNPSSNNSRITVTENGSYIASLKLQYAGVGGSGTYRDDVEISINGTNAVGDETAWVEVNAFGRNYTMTTPIFPLTAGQYVEAWLRQTSGGTRTVTGGQFGTRFSLMKVG